MGASEQMSTPGAPGSVKNPVGAAQGRLPGAAAGDWQNEFFIASHLGVDGIELSFDSDPAKHPLMTEPGLDMIRRLSAETGVRTLSVFASFFSSFPLHKANSDTDSILPILKRLIRGCRKVSAAQLVLPCGGESAIESSLEAKALVKALGACMTDAISCGVNIALLCDLPPDKKLTLVREFDSPAVSLAYDTSVRGATDPVKEINTYGPYISSVHVRDRMAGGEPAPLGRGDVDLRLICHKLREQAYGGPFILWGDTHGGDDAFKQALAYMRGLLS